MPDQYTPNLGLVLMARGDLNWDTTLNSQLTTLDALGALGQLAVSPTEFPSTTLRVKVSAGTYQQASGTAVSYSGTAALVLTANSSNYLYLTDAGVLTTSTTNWPTGVNVVRLAIVLTGAAAVNSVIDSRCPYVSFGASAGAMALGGTIGGSPTVGSVLTVGSGGILAQVTAVPISAGGTGQTTASNALNALLPTQTGNSGKVLTTNGTSPSWATGPGGSLLATNNLGDVSSPATSLNNILPVQTGNSGRVLSTDGAGTVFWASVGGVGTVTSVGLGMPSEFTVTGSPITGSGTLTAAWVTQSANKIHAGPTTGSAAAPTFRSLVPADYPVFIASGGSHAAGAVPDPGSSSGTTRFLREDATWVAPSGSGTVTSVGLTAPSWLDVSGSPVTSSGTIAVTAANTTTANFVLAAPNGSTGALSPRALVPADYPVFIASGGSHTAGAVPDPGASAGSTKFLREDATWAVPSSAGTVTSVGLSVPSWLTVTGSPVTSSGTIAVTATNTTTANFVLAAPDGSAGALIPRALAPGDLPTALLRINSHYGTWQPLPSMVGTTITIDWAVSDRWYGTLPTTLIDFAYTNVPASGRGQVLLLRLTQPASGATVPGSWPAGSVFPGGTAHFLTQVNSATDLVTVSLNPGGGYDTGPAFLNLL